MRALLVIVLWRLRLRLRSWLLLLRGAEEGRHHGLLICVESPVSESGLERRML